MDKQRKPNATRKPPVPSDSHAEIEDWAQRVMPDLQPIVKRLDESICETIPGLQYALKWKKAYYGLPELGWIIELVAPQTAGESTRQHSWNDSRRARGTPTVAARERSPMRR
jgi:hypothetical protein